MFHAVDIRPDLIMRTGVWQPYGVRGESPVAAARSMVDPFVSAVRGDGPYVMSGALGIPSAEYRTALGAGALVDNKYAWGIAGAALGFLGCVLYGRMR